MYLAEVMPEISYSSMSDGARCWRAFYYSYISGLQLIEPSWPIKQGKYADECLGLLHNKDKNNVIIFNVFKNERNEEGELPAQYEAMFALFEAYIKLDKHLLKGIPQYEFKWQEEDYPRIHGYIDLMQYDDSEGGRIAWEFKYTGRPDAYDHFSLQEQLSTYFIGVPFLQRITVRCIQVPQLRMGKNESNQDFHQRVYNDVLARPKHYFMDTSYWRSEFDLEQTKFRAKMVAQHAQELVRMGDVKYFIQNIGPSCVMPQPCFYLPICESHGVISDTLYKTREKGDTK